jgi:hypothetical protein
LAQLTSANDNNQNGECSDKEYEMIDPDVDVEFVDVKDVKENVRSLTHNFIK